MYKNIDKEIAELKNELNQTYMNWKRKHKFNKYNEDFNHFIIFYSDGEYDPPLNQVINCLEGWIVEDE